MRPDPLAVAARGLAVFALQPGAKTVRRPGWQTTATSDPDTIAATWRDGDNIGVGCWASQILGLDLDVKDDLDGIARFAHICTVHGADWPDTLAVRTPSGGLHLYFAVPAGLLIGSTAGRSPRSPLGPGIDTRGPGAGGRGGYLVGPGSIVDGTAYTIDSDQPIAHCPTWLADLLATGDRPRPPEDRTRAAVPAARAAAGDPTYLLCWKPGRGVWAIDAVRDGARTQVMWTGGLTDQHTADALGWASREIHLHTGRQLTGSPQTGPTSWNLQLARARRSGFPT